MDSGDIVPLCIAYHYKVLLCRSQLPRGLRRRPAAAHLLRLRVRIPPGAWMSVCCECCVVSGRGLCDELITCPEESYRLWCVVCDLETSIMMRPWATGGCCVKKNVIILTDKHKCADLIYWFIFSATACFGCLHRPSSGRYRFIGTVEMVEYSPNKQRCKIVSSSDNCYS